MSSIAEAVVSVKADKDKNVRDSAMNCINGLRNVLGENFMQIYSHKTKSVVAMKKEEATRSGSKGGSRWQGKPRTIDEDPFKTNQKPTKRHLFPGENETQPQRLSSASNKVQQMIPKSNLNQVQADSSVKKTEPRLPIKERQMSEAFRGSLSKGVEIYVNYPCPEGEVDNEDEGNKSELDGDVNLEEHHEESQDEDVCNQSSKEKEVAKSELEDSHTKELQNFNKNQEQSIGDKKNKLEKPVNKDEEEIDACDEGEITEHVPEVFERDSDARVLITDTHRMEIDETDMDYNPQSYHKKSLSRHQAVDFHEPEIEEFNRHEDRLSRENIALQSEYSEHQKIIEYQNRRIEGLMMQINNLSTNLNIVLNKAATLEQNVFHLNYQSHVPYGGQMVAPLGMQQYGMTHVPVHSFGAGQTLGSQPASLQSARSHGLTDYMYQVSSMPMAGQERTFNTNTSMPTPREEIEMVRRQLEEKSHEVSEWQLRRKEEEAKLREKLSKLNKAKKDSIQPEVGRKASKLPARKITGENKIQYRAKEELPVRESGTKQYQTNQPTRPKIELSKKGNPKYQNLNSEREDSLERMGSQAPKPITKISVKQPQLESMVEGNRGDEFELDRENRQRIRAAKTMNLTLARLLKDSEYRRLLDFLADKDNFKSIGMIDTSNLQGLVIKITDMLSYKAEAYIEECLPWISRLISAGHISSPCVAEDLLYVVKMVLGADKKRKMYQHHIIVQLQALTVDIEELIEDLKVMPSRRYVN